MLLKTETRFGNCLQLLTMVQKQPKLSVFGAFRVEREYFSGPGDKCHGNFGPIGPVQEI